MTNSAEAYNDETDEKVQPDIDSKYRLIIVAAKRSKQIQRGAHPRVEMDTQKHKPTRVALEELNQKKVPFKIVGEE
jgi:DNA-directed RNA polymerase subunit omega